MKTFWTAPRKGATIKELEGFIDSAVVYMPIALLSHFNKAREHLFNLAGVRHSLPDEPKAGNYRTNLALGGGEPEPYDIARIENAE